MLHQPTLDKLEAMRLKGMIEAWKAQEKDPAASQLSFGERLGMLVEHQQTWRASQALRQRLHRARLPTQAVVEDIDFRAPRGLDRQSVRSLAECSAWAGRHENIFVIGPTGVGKSYLACALAQKACRDGTPRSTSGRRPCSANWPWRAPTAACAICFCAGPRSKCWSSTTGPWRR